MVYLGHPHTFRRIDPSRYIQYLPSEKYFMLPKLESESSDGETDNRVIGRDPLQVVDEIDYEENIAIQSLPDLHSAQGMNAEESVTNQHLFDIHSELINRSPTQEVDTQENIANQSFPEIDPEAVNRPPPLVLETNAEESVANQSLPSIHPEAVNLSSMHTEENVNQSLSSEVNRPSEIQEFNLHNDFESPTPPPLRLLISTTPLSDEVRI